MHRSSLTAPVLVGLVVLGTWMVSTSSGQVSPTATTALDARGRTPITSLPYTISKCGSYYVTRCLTGVSGQHGITVDSDDVTIDLNGYTLVGVPGSLDGIHVTAAKRNVGVFNGGARDWGGTGVNAANARNGRLEDLRLSDNGQYGLYAGSDSTVESCTALENGSTGIYGGAGTSITGCTSQHNGDRGIDTLVGSTLIECTAAFNDGNGIVGGGATAIIDCATWLNGLNGFETGSGATVRGCTASNNADNGFIVESDGSMVDCTSTGNGGNGIVAFFSGNRIAGCSVSGNGGDGIQVEATGIVVGNNSSFNGQGGTGSGIKVVNILLFPTNNRIEGNNVVGNATAGIEVPFTGNTVMKNSASDNGTDYLIAAGNDVGPIGSAATSTSPWANLQY